MDRKGSDLTLGEQFRFSVTYADLWEPILNLRTRFRHLGDPFDPLDQIQRAQSRFVRTSPEIPKLVLKSVEPVIRSRLRTEYYFSR